MLKLDDTERAKYERREENKRYRESLFYTAEFRGLKKGIKQGLKKGIQKGMEKGAKNREIEIAKSLLLAQVDIKIITETTGLTIQEIERLKN